MKNEILTPFTPWPGSGKEGYFRFLSISQDLQPKIQIQLVSIHFQYFGLVNIKYGLRTMDWVRNTD